MLTLIWMFLPLDGSLAGPAFGNLAESSAVFLADNVKYLGDLEAACTWVSVTESSARLGLAATLTHPCCFSCACIKAHMHIKVCI